jgi:hypothetical protein
MYFNQVKTLLLQKLPLIFRLGEITYNPNELCLHFLRGMYILMRLSYLTNPSNPNNRETPERNQLHSQR